MTNPSSQRANVTTLKSSSGNCLRMKGRLNSPVFGSSRCEPAMCTFAFAQPGECELAGGRGRDDLHAADLFHHSRKQAGSRIAAGQHEPFLRRFFLGEHHQVRTAIGASGSLDDAIGLRHVVRRGADRNADPARSDLADAHRLAFRRRRRAEHFGGEGLGRFLAVRPGAKTARRPSLPARARDSAQLRYWERRSRLRSRRSSGG